MGGMGRCGSGDMQLEDAGWQWRWICMVFLIVVFFFLYILLCLWFMTFGGMDWYCGLAAKDGDYCEYTSQFTGDMDSI